MHAQLLEHPFLASEVVERDLSNAVSRQEGVGLEWGMILFTGSD